METAHGRLSNVDSDFWSLDRIGHLADLVTWLLDFVGINLSPNPNFGGCAQCEGCDDDAFYDNAERDVSTLFL